MQLEGTQFIAADRATVWAALNDPEILKVCLPGCESFDRTGENSFEMIMKQKIGPVSATFRGNVDLENVDPPNGYSIVGEGKGGAAGFAKGAANVALSDAEGGTDLRYGVEVKIGGKIAQLGARLIDGFARKLADQFFGRFKEQVEGPGASEPGVIAAVVERVEERFEQVDDAVATLVERVEERVEVGVARITKAVDDAPVGTSPAPTSSAAPAKLPWWKALWKRLFG